MAGPGPRRRRHQRGGTGGDTGGDGGNGGDTGGPGGGAGGPGTPGDGCTAAFRTVNSWSGGCQGEVTVRNGGSTALRARTVELTLAQGQSLGSVWNGRNTGTTGTITVRDAEWNGALAPAGSTAFGFTVDGGPGAPSSLTCTGI
ncbi:cellulose binding domain-containing protein [Streptomyces sp. enrichment culture]|uniref:cellulose binding domain-containing protein n=1 Tax=Streptomyces sp. enrichment culture TaxID=1795815 RepID=UPI003F555AD4